MESLLPVKRHCRAAPVLLLRSRVGDAPCAGGFGRGLRSRAAPSRHACTRWWRLRRQQRALRQLGERAARSARSFGGFDSTGFTSVALNALGEIRFGGFSIFLNAIKVGDR
jgi:hypothetical protein